MGIQIGHGHRVGHHRAFVDEQEERLLRMELEASPNYRHELGDIDVVWDQELAAVHEWETALPIESLDDDWHLVGLLTANIIHVSLAII